MSISARRPGRPQKQAGLDTRDRILDAALELFAQYGYEGTSVRQIARAVRLSESALYNHFASKQALYETLLAESGPSIAQQIVGDLLPQLSDLEPPIILRTIILRAFQLWDTPRARKTVSVLMQEIAKGSQDIRSDVLASIEQAQTLLGGILDSWHEKGLLQTSHSSHQIIWEFFAPLATIRFFYLNASATETDISEAHRMAAMHIDFMLAMLFPDHVSSDISEH